MKNLNRAQAANAEKHLNTVLRYPDGIMTRAEWLKLAISKGASSETKQVPSVEYNRTKYNRMNGWEQEEYEKKMKIMKTDYRIKFPDGTFYSVSKTEHEHFKSLQLQEDIETGRRSLENRIEAGIATEEEIKKDEQKEFEFFNKYFNNKTT